MKRENSHGPSTYTLAIAAMWMKIAVCLWGIETRWESG
jgi:hypothetical protein